MFLECNLRLRLEKDTLLDPLFQVLYTISSAKFIYVHYDKKTDVKLYDLLNGLILIVVNTTAIIAVRKLTANLILQNMKVKQQRSKKDEMCFKV